LHGPTASEVVDDTVSQGTGVNTTNVNTGGSTPLSVLPELNVPLGSPNQPSLAEVNSSLPAGITQDTTPAPASSTSTSTVNITALPGPLISPLAYYAGGGAGGGSDTPAAKKKDWKWAVIISGIAVVGFCLYEVS